MLDGSLLPFPVGNFVMMGVGLTLLALAIKKGYEPLLLVPIGFGAILVNIPDFFTQTSGALMEPPVGGQVGGFLWYIYQAGIITELIPILIFIAIGSMCDFGALLERPWLMIFAAAGQIGIFVALLSALSLGFKPLEASSIGIIGAMDGPTAIYITSMHARDLLPAVSVVAYTYMAMVPIFQVPLSRALTTRRERLIRMEYKPIAYPRTIRILFPIIVTLITGIIVPQAIPLMGALMFGNFMRESGVVERLAKSSENELANIVTLLLGITIGGTMGAERFLRPQTLMIFGLGVVAFVAALSVGILFAKAACFLTKGKVNPLLGACGVSAFPMAGRTAHMIGRKEDPDNWLLPHAVATNTGGQIASVIAGGTILTFAPLLLAG